MNTNPFAHLHPKRLVDALLPPGLVTPEAQRGSRLVVRVALLTLGVSSLMDFVYVLDGAPALVFITSVSLTLQVLGLVLHRVTGSYKVGGHMHCLSMWALFFGIATLSGGIDSPNLVANLFIVVLAPMLLGRRHGLFWLGAVGVTYFAQFQLASHGVIQQTLQASDIASMRLTELIVTSATTGITAYFFAKGEERMRRELANEKHLIEVANADLRIILDNAGQGFLSLDAKGRLIGERSAVIETWLAGFRPGARFADLLRPFDPLLADRFEAEWLQVEAGFLPLEVCLDQLPKLLLVGNTSLSLEYRAVRAGAEGVEKFVVIISDISAEVARREADMRQRDLLDAFERILRDPDGFLLFMKHARRDVERVLRAEVAGGELKRCLHTLKGNSAVMGLSALARACHDIEDELLRDAEPTPVALRTLERELETVERRLLQFVSTNADVVSLNAAEYAGFCEAVAAHTPHRELEQLGRSWANPRVDRHLLRLAEYAAQLAQRLEKGAIELQVRGGELRVPPGFGEFWEVASHVVRNAVDHGIERPALRKGKGPGRLGLAASVSDGRTVVEISDDGRGIDWQKIRELARERGLPAESERDLLDALLSDGLSTSKSVTDISGRGVGMSSVRTACAQMAIAIEARSSPGLGTTFRFVFPERPPPGWASAAE